MPPQQIIHSLQNSSCIYDFKEKAVAINSTFYFTRHHLEVYRTYLASQGLTPAFIGSRKGAVILADYLESGTGLASFQKILSEWCAEEGVNIHNRTKIININY